MGATFSVVFILTPFIPYVMVLTVEIIIIRYQTGTAKKRVLILNTEVKKHNILFKVENNKIANDSTIAFLFFLSKCKKNIYILFFKLHTTSI